MNKFGTMAVMAISLGCSLVFADGKTEKKNSGIDILEVSVLTVTDFEQTGGLYKAESEHGKDQYALEYKFALAAAALGSKDSMLWLGELYQGGHIPGVTGAQAVNIAIDWWKKAYDAGQPRGYTNIGLLYMHTTVPGGGDNFASVDIDYDKALDYLTKASDAGDMKAPRQLGLFYATGRGAIKQNDVKAVEYFAKASKLNDSTGTLYYADYLLAGKGVAQDVSKALSLYQSLVDTKAHDIASGAYKLGVIYEEGKYVSANKEFAAKYYQIGADNGSTDAKTALTRLSK